jgi:membrane peptidoglycan carboxypeptidase
VVDSGTGTAARQPFPVFGKTGTTDDFTNAWFTGCTRTLCIAVWMGYEKQYLHNGRDPHRMILPGVGEVFGGTLPARIFAQTWDAYRILQQPHGTLSPSPTPSPAATFTGRPAPSASTSVKPRHSTEPSSKPTESKSPGGVPSPSPSPSRTLLPTPAAQSPEVQSPAAQAARRERFAT